MQKSTQQKKSGKWDSLLVSVSGIKMLLSYDNLMMISECGVVILLLERFVLSFKKRKSHELDSK